jgi:predicted GIY-YIG superfamily endonuclease
MPGAFLYVLHFDTKLSHAEHYTGVTVNVPQRLEAHAKGEGSAICAALKELGIGWRLAALYYEHTVKRHHNGPRYCQVCNPEARIPGATEYPVELLKCPTTSEGYNGI